MISILGPTSKQVIDITNNRLLIIQGATWEDYWTLSNEDLKVEFIQGLLYIHSPANIIHEEIFGYLLTELRNYLKAKPIGKIWGSRFPIMLEDGGRAEPDLLFLSNDEIEKGLSETLFKGSPSWVIEIVSPSYRDHDTELKREEYRKIGVKEYWIIDYDLRIIDITRYYNQQITFNKVLTEGKLHPEVEGLKEFSINILSFWEEIRNSLNLNNK